MKTCILSIVLCLASVCATAQGVRLKDLTSFEGVRSNELVGYGLVIGLDGTGDSLRNAPFTEDMLSNILERLGVNVVGEQFRAKNVASVIVTGSLPPFGRAGGRFDVTVSAIGDATNLRGGTLVMTPLNAANGQVYAVAQGSIIAGGFAVEGEAARAVQGVPTAGSIPSGAVIEREVDFDLANLTTLTIALNSPDFSTAARIEKSVNSKLGVRAAKMRDSGTVVLNVHAVSGYSPARLLALIENVEIHPENVAKVVVDQRSGTIVMSENVRISRVALSKGNLTLSVNERPIAIQPNPFSDGETIVVPRTDLGVLVDDEVALSEVSASATLSDLVSGLNALGVTSNDLIDILQTIKAAGALHADLIVK